jgi:hypothetical protein
MEKRMNLKARKTIATLTLFLIIGLAGYAGARVSNTHGRAVARSNQVIHLGTIYVTPEDTSEHAALLAHAQRERRYAARSGSKMRTERRGLQAYVGARRSI